MRWWGLLLLLEVCGVSGCRKPNPDFMADDLSAMESSSSEGDADSYASSSTGVDTEGEDVCAIEPDPIGSCPPECDSCEDAACQLRCQGAEACQDTEVVCPEGWSCEVRCQNAEACRGATIRCSPLHGCEVECVATEACAQARVICGDGPCDVVCRDGDEVCDGLTLVCGDSDSRVTCDAPTPSPPQVEDSGSSCACEVVSCS